MPAGVVEMSIIRGRMAVAVLVDVRTKGVTLLRCIRCRAPLAEVKDGEKSHASSADTMRKIVDHEVHCFEVLGDKAGT